MTRAAGFLALLVIVGLVAFGVGKVFGDGAETEGRVGADAAEPVAGHGHAAAEEAPAEEATLPGLAVAAAGFRLELLSTTLSPGRDEVAFRILDEHGEAVREFDVVHEKPMHLILARRDLGDFQHLHPELGDDGTWRTTTTLLPGTYRAFADFESAGERAVLGADVSVAGNLQIRPAPAPSDTAKTGPYTVRLHGDLTAARESPLRFEILRDSDEIEPEPYLGARGHLVVLREGDLAYIHAHPRESSEQAVFDTEVPTTGRYRVYLQFAVDGEVRTAEWAVEAA